MGEEDRVSGLESRALVKKLEESRIYKDYEKAFSRATGLPLAIRPLQSFNLAQEGKESSNRFCSLMAESNRGCEACFRMQQKLEEEAQMAPRTLKCFAGLCDTAVPIRVGKNLVAFLQTGQILLNKPNQEEFNSVAKSILTWGTQTDLKVFEEAYFQTKVLDKDQYEAFIQLLNTFAKHLSDISNQLLIQGEEQESPTIRQAKDYLNSSFSRSITLGEAAEYVNVSAHYFSKMFKKSTGLTFTEYLSRIRVEKAKDLLQNPNNRISAIAYDVGFDSLSQFNRTFKRISGVPPKEYRKQIEAEL
jgi:AraC-like DNA-binding protein